MGERIGLEDYPIIRGEIRAKHIEVARGVVIEPGALISGLDGEEADFVHIGERSKINGSTKIFVDNLFVGNDCVIDADVLKARKARIGRGVKIGERTLMLGEGGPAEEIVLGDYSLLGERVKILVPVFKLGDYSKFWDYSFCHGTLPLQIGRSCWIGHNVGLDSLGGLDIDDFVGIGSLSQIWTHIQFGDPVEGTRFMSKKYMHIKKDAWFVGRCDVAPVEVGEKSMALLASNITRDMQPNHVYGGNPARDVTDKVGVAYEKRSTLAKVQVLTDEILNFELTHPEFRGELVVVCDKEQIIDDKKTYFNVADRSYTKKHNPSEVEFLKRTLAKFSPIGEPPFVVPRNLSNGNLQV